MTLESFSNGGLTIETKRKPGNVYGYQITDDTTRKTLESFFGFVGDPDYAFQAGCDALQERLGNRTR